MKQLTVFYDSLRTEDILSEQKVKSSEKSQSLSISNFVESLRKSSAGGAHTSLLTAATGSKLDYHSSLRILIIPPTDQVQV